MTYARLSLWICNRNRNLQHAIADRQSNFQACSIDHADISPFRINKLRAVLNSVAQNPPSRISDSICPLVPIVCRRARFNESAIVSDLLMSLDHLRRFTRARPCARRGTLCDPAHQSGPRSNDQTSDAYRRKGYWVLFVNMLIESESKMPPN